jgi:two-component system sensor histidine kinase UhpB
LKVQDDGRGITEEQVLGTQSLGLLGMQERVHVFGGSISFVGKRGQGTTVLVLIPLEKEGPSEDSRGG